MNQASALVFRTEKSDDNDASDIWDDTALIKAYDKAIKSIQGRGSNEESGEVENGRSSASNASRRRKRKYYSHHKMNRKKQGWKVGDRCRATYTEDEFIYDAVIKLIDSDTSTCWVTYIGYGNEEEKELSELMSAGSESASPSRPVNGDFEAGYESMDYPNHTQSPAHSGSEFRGQNYNSYQGAQAWHQPHSQFIPPGPPRMHWPPHPMQPSFTPPSMPPFPYYPGSGFMPQGFGMPHIPSMIPPPPPMSTPPEVHQEGNEEALHSMLMSWYMSGYHTGYYQGLKQGRSSFHSASPRMPESRRQSERQSRPRNSGAQSR
ncbi:survival motor neuron protein-like [Asterias rubens]|uniref:survival motor neuron protein-like n=1 Tax=Asterias rubens TaxID=7604 RepID=UPI0014557C7F|nr:survival motor neuron protein-like [Asterias rubens]XP_033634943.1 survival motor neuron protein-like [Asterias rubens]XP_033634944.1 survival motor neuron protein-like [Asterias rubens]